MDGAPRGNHLVAEAGGGRRRRAVVSAVAVVAVVVGLALVAWAPPSLAQQPGQIAVVTDPDGLNLRAGPGTEFQSLGVLPQGTELTVLGPFENGVWLPVSHQGRRGFVHSDYIQIRAAPPASTPAATPTPSATPTSAPTVSP